MHNHLIAITFLMVFACFIRDALANSADEEGSKPDTGIYSIVFENDMLGHPKSDRDYTMGMSFSRTNEYSADYENKMPPWQSNYLDILKWINRHTLNKPVYSENNPSTGKSGKVWWQLGDTAFTPNNLTNPNPIYDDRPYANLIYLAAGYYTEQRNSALYIGFLGTSIGRVVQTDIHRICCADDLPQGWKYQIASNNVSPTFLWQETFNHRVRTFSNQDSTSTYKASIDGIYGFSFGYYTRAIIGLTGSYGSTPEDYSELIESHSSPIHSYKENISIPSIPAKADKAVPDTKTVVNPETPGNIRYQPTPHKTGFGVWFNYEISAFAYNELLEGALTSSNAVKFDYSQIYPIVQLVTLGADLAFIPKYFGADIRNWDLYYSLNWKSKEIRTNMEPPYHSWGTLNLSWKIK